MSVPFPESCKPLGHLPGVHGPIIRTRLQALFRQRHQRKDEERQRRRAERAAERQQKAVERKVLLDQRRRRGAERKALMGKKRRDIALLHRQGLSVSESARRMHISELDVKKYLRAGHVLVKLHCGRCEQLVAFTSEVRSRKPDVICPKCAES
jgi:DNA-binding CsgD family transcriptional regulator